MTLRALIDDAGQAVVSATPFWLPVATGIAALSFRVQLKPELLLPAAALTVASLMGLSAITFTRLKDAAAIPKPEVGVDPATTSYLLFRRVNRAAVEALLLGGLCVIGMTVGEDWRWLTSALLLMGLTYIGIRLLNVLLTLRREAEHVVGDRYVQVSGDSRPEVRLAK